MRADETAGEPVWADLAEPRAPSEAELRLLSALAEVVDEPLLDDQLATVVVRATCRCGCSSVRLRSAGRAVPAARVAQLSSNGRDDYCAVVATSRGPQQQFVSVVLHVVHGQVEELEVFDTEHREGAAVPLVGLALDEPTLL